MFGVLTSSTAWLWSTALLSSMPVQTSEFSHSIV